MLIIKQNSRLFSLLAITLSLTLIGCNTIPEDALALRKESLENRALQTRKYQTLEEKDLLSASAAVLQDLGFNLDESETDLGVIVGSKTRDATDATQIAATVFLAVLQGVAAAYGGGAGQPPPAVDETQVIRASLVTRPSESEGSSLVRVTFQRTVWNTDGVISRVEAINEPQIYQDFFSRLNKAIFLEGQKI